jgi:P27 family predicted phage terminase small subunit
MCIFNIKRGNRNIQMKPQSYLTKEGIKIFNELLKHCQEKGISEKIDSFELSMLANEFDKYATAAHEAKENETGLYNKFKNGTVQVNAFHTIMKDSYGLIMKHSPKFGLNPIDREKILGLSKKEEKKDPFADLNK